MPRNYTRKTVKPDEQKMQDAVNAVKNGKTLDQAVKLYNVSKTSLWRHVKGTGNVGRPTTFSAEEEAIIADTLQQMADWGIGFSVTDVQILFKKYLESIEREVPYFKNNYPGYDFIKSFMERNNMTNRAAGNIKRSRAAISKIDIESFFTELDKAGDILPQNFYNYDETALADDPGNKKVLVRRGTRRVELVREHSKSNISIMICGNAAGDLLPPFVCYKAKNLYEGWMQGGPSGTEYSATASGWFEMDTFQRWFMKIFIPKVSNDKSPKVLIGDNLASHFNHDVIRIARENNIYFCTLPPNSTHLMQPLDVSVFRSFKQTWREILQNYRKESRQKGAIQKTAFPVLLSELWQKVQKNIGSNLKSGFRACGLVPRNSQEPIKRLPGENKSENVGRQLDSVLIEILQTNRNPTTGRGRGRGAKLSVVPGRAITEPAQASTSQASAAPTVLTENLQEEPSSSEDEEDECFKCKRAFKNYRGPDWYACIICKQWFCGICNKANTDPYYTCMNC